jgi:hypothetical protein
MAKFWVLVAACGDRAELYDALSAEVPPMSDTEFQPAARYIQILRATGELAPPPILLESLVGLDASKHQVAWRSLVEELRTTSGPSAQKVTDFRASVNSYCQQGMEAIEAEKNNIGRHDAKDYLRSLGSLADALSRSQQFAQVQSYVQQGGCGFHGGSALALINHMLRNRLEAARGRSAQLALSEVARPMSRLLEQEIALHYERIDSLAAREGHRPYAAEYRRHESPVVEATPGVNVTQTAPTSEAGT